LSGLDLVKKSFTEKETAKRDPNYD
jgi:hypothetical protein